MLPPVVDVLVLAAAIGTLAIATRLGCVALTSGLHATYERFRGTRAFRCPQTHAPVAVRIEWARALLSAALGQPRFDVKSCSLWPARGDCSRSCAELIEAAPDRFLLGAWLDDWYRGRACALCGVRLGGLRARFEKPALRAADGKSVQWFDVAPEVLPQALATHDPVCWNCHIGELFGRIATCMPGRM